jgi:hypothetical protein
MRLAKEGDSAVVDPKSRRELEKRVEAISQMLQLVDKREKLELGDDGAKLEARFTSLKRYLHNNHTLAGLVDEQPGLPGAARSLDSFGPFPKHYSDTQKLAELVQEYQRLGIQLAASRKSGRERLDDLCEAVNRKDFTADTFAKWAKTDGLVLGATLVVSAAAMALTFGAATPIVAAAIGAGVGIAANDGIRELQYRSGLRDDASLLGDYLRGKQIVELDGTKRQMNAVNDVALVYAKELGIGTVMGFAGSELGGTIGGRLFKELAEKSSAVRQAVLSQNKAAMKVLAQSVQQLEHAAVAPSLKAFGVAFGRELMSQSGFSVADHIARSGVTGAAHRLGVELDDNNMIVGAALNVVLSAAHRGVSLKMQLSSGLHAAAAPKDAARPTRTRSATHEVFYHAQDPVKEQAFIRDLEMSGLRIERTSKGFSAMVEGRRINFNRTAKMSAHNEPETYSATFFEKPQILDWMDRMIMPGRRNALRQLADSLLGHVAHEQEAFLRSDRWKQDPCVDSGLALGGTLKGDPLANRIMAEVRLMHMLGEPQFAEAVRLYGELSRLKGLSSSDPVFKTAGSKEFQLESAQKRLDSLLSDLPASAREKLLSVVGSAAKKVEPLLIAIEKYQQELAKRTDSKISEQERKAYLDILEATRNLHGDSDLKSLKLAFAAERDYLPPGSYRMPTFEGRRVLVTVEPGNGVMRDKIDQVLNRIEQIGVIPKELVFTNRLDLLGGANSDGQVLVRASEADYLFLAVVDHESGHLHEYSLDFNSAAYKNVDKVYRNCLKSAAKDIHDKAIQLKDDIPGSPDQLIDSILKNPNALPEKGKLTAYFAGRNEMMAEMFAMYLYEQRCRGGTRPTFEEVLRNCVANKDVNRAQIMRHFKPMYEHLRSTMFEKFGTDRDTSWRFKGALMEPAHNECRRDLHQAFAQHGAASLEVRAKFGVLNEKCIESAKEALIDTLFAREHNLDIATFHHMRLDAELFRKYREYKEFAKPEYSPPADHPGSSSFARAVRAAHKLYLENVGQAETLGKNRATSELRDITKAHLSDFIEHFAPGLSGEVQSKWLLGMDRHDSNGHLADPSFTRIAHSFSPEEVTADLFRLYLEKQRASSQVYGKPFVDQLRMCFGEKRAKQLSNFPELSRKLERDVFPYFERVPSERRSGVD